MSIFFAIVALTWLLLVYQLLRDERRLRDLPPRTALGSGSLPSVSVVIAARDEEARIEATVRRLLAQEDVDLEVIAVDDRSTDRTGTLLRSLAEADPRVKALRVEALPEGWLGKCHACHLASQSATGDWLLFTDADVWMKPDVLARALRAALAEGADHVCLVFGPGRGTLASKACHLLAVLSLAKHAARVGSHPPRDHLGVGAFNLVRAAAYREVGGHAPLRLTVCEDHSLGLLLRRAGRSTRAFLAGTDVEAEWFATLGGAVKALEKNYFAARDYRLRGVLLTLPFYLLLWTAGVVGPWTGTPAGLAAGLGLLLVMVPAGLLAPRLGVPRRAALLVPFILPVAILIMANSVYRTLRQGGVRWRDTFYPLDVLREGNYR